MPPVESRMGPNNKPQRVIRVPRGANVRVIAVPTRPNTGSVGAMPGAPTGGGVRPGARRVVVVRRKKDEKRKFLLPLAAAVALLAGGTTYGLWYSTQHFGGGQITAGDLDLEVQNDGKMKWFDVSPDRRDSDAEAVAFLNDLTTVPDGADWAPQGFYNKFNNNCAEFNAGECLSINEAIPTEGRSAFTSAHRIDCIDNSGPACADKDTWKIVPGDTIVGLIQATMRLEGDNLVAALEFECDGMTLADYERLRTEFPEMLNLHNQPGALASSNIADLVTIETDIYLNMEPNKAEPVDLAALLPGAQKLSHLGYFEGPSGPDSGQLFGVPDSQWGTPPGEQKPFVTTLPAGTTRDSLGEGEVTLLLTIHFSENADERQLAALPLAQIYSGRLALSQVRGIDTPGQFVQSTPSPTPPTPSPDLGDG